MIRFLLLLVLAGLFAATAWAVPTTSARYTVTFDATWSAVSHPESFPPNAHFSGLVGGTHSGAADFWQVGQPATTGIKHMAEWGTQATLAGEVQAAIDAGDAGSVVLGDVLWVVPGQISTDFVITPDFPLVSLVAMIAPSPDWFVGVDGLDLTDQDTWRSEIVVPLWPYDAGTDSGATYTSPDQATMPPQPIAAITGSPFTPGVPLGTLTFRLDGVSAAPVPAATGSLNAVPNPFNPATTLHYAVPRGAQQVQLAIFDARGRLVRRLAAAQSPGDHAIIWDGTDDRGSPVGGGVYLARLATGRTAVVQKVTLVP